MKIIPFVFLLSMLLWACTPKSPEDHEDNIYYTCSMDPQVIEKKPGKCPICKMELTRIVMNPNAQKNSLKLSKDQVALGNIETIKIGAKDLASSIVLNGQVVVDEHNRYNISSRVSGRIDKLYVKNVGSTIAEGTLLYEIYSEELLLAQQEYLIASQRMQNTADQQSKSIFEASKNKLLLWGMSEKQINTLTEQGKTLSLTVKIYSKYKGIVTAVNSTEGAYIMEGTALFEIVDLSTVWVEAQLYATELGMLEGNDPVEIHVAGTASDQVFKSKVQFVAPQLEAQSKINLIRAEINNKNLMLKPGMQATIQLIKQTQIGIAVPQRAVIQDAQDAKVWILKNGNYESRMVVLGKESGDHIEIRSGLAIGDSVVISGAYLLNSEYIFKHP